jgi:hypothetical protein
MENNDIWYGCYAMGRYSKLILFKFLHMLIPTSRLLEVVRWINDDAITHDPLRIRITNLTSQT